MDVQAKVTSKGQITIPKVVREALGLTEGDTLLFRVEDGRATLARTPSLLELAASVPVPPGKRRVRWNEARDQAWEKQTTRHR